MKDPPQRPTRLLGSALAGRGGRSGGRARAGATRSIRLGPLAWAALLLAMASPASAESRSSRITLIESLSGVAAASRAALAGDPAHLVLQLHGGAESGSDALRASNIIPVANELGLSVLAVGLQAPSVGPNEGHPAAGLTSGGLFPVFDWFVRQTVDTWHAAQGLGVWDVKRGPRVITDAAHQLKSGLHIEGRHVSIRPVLNAWAFSQGVPLLLNYLFSQPATGLPTGQVVVVGGFLADKQAMETAGMLFPPASPLHQTTHRWGMDVAENLHGTPAPTEGAPPTSVVNAVHGWADAVVHPGLLSTMLVRPRGVRLNYFTHDGGHAWPDASPPDWHSWQPNASRGERRKVEQFLQNAARDTPGVHYHHQRTPRGLTRRFLRQLPH